MARRPSPQMTAVLTALAEAGADWSHGYDLCRTLGLKAGTVYPILIRLTERGQVETAWETDPPRGRPARHLYRLTDAAAAAPNRGQSGSSALTATPSPAAMRNTRS